MQPVRAAINSLKFKIMVKTFFIQFDYSNLYLFYALNYDEKYSNKYYREELSCDAASYHNDEMKPLYAGNKHKRIIKSLIPDLWAEYNFQQFYKDAEKLKIWG